MESVHVEEPSPASLLNEQPESSGITEQEQQSPPPSDPRNEEVGEENESNEAEENKPVHHQALKPLPRIISST